MAIGLCTMLLTVAPYLGDCKGAVANSTASANATAGGISADDGGNSTVGAHSPAGAADCHAFNLMVFLSLVIGFFDGCFITMFGPIAFEICGPVGAAQGIGFILGLCSIPLTVGPPVAGKKSSGLSLQSNFYLPCNVEIF